MRKSIRAEREIRMKKLLIVSYTSSMKDPRVFKEWSSLHNDFEVTIAGWKPAIPEADFVEIRKGVPSRLDKIRFGLGMMLGDPKPFLDSFELDAAALKDRRFDLVLCNDLFPLPLSFELAKGAPVFWDAHEYYPEEHEDSLQWRLVFKRTVMKIARKYIPRVAGMSTVSPAIAERYEKEYGKKPVLIRNVPVFTEGKHVPAGDKVRLVYVGDAHPGRRIDSLIRMMRLLEDRFTLDFYLVAHPENQSRLKKMAEGDPRIRFHDPVPMSQLCGELRQYDLGLAVFFPTNYNFEKGLPNKLFEYIQGRLGIVSGPSSEIGAVIRQYGNGVSAAGFSEKELADAVRSLTKDEVEHMKQASDAAAVELCAEKEMPKLKTALLRILNRDEGK